MDRSREGRRASSIVGSNGFNNRRKNRTNSLRDSPDEDTGVELQQESIKLRDRVKKDRDREMNRDRERGRDLRERGERDLRERRINSNNNKRRRAERLMTSRDEIASSDESENDDLDEEYEETTTAGVRLVPTAAVGSISHHHQAHLTNHHHHSEHQQITSNSTVTANHDNNNNSNLMSGNHHNNHRKSFPPISSSSSTSKQLYRPLAPVWKPADEMIGVSVPRKARSASTKRLHEWASNSSHNSGGVAGGEQILRQASNSPVGQSGVVSTPPATPMSPSSSNASTKKKLKPMSGNVSNGQKLKPPKVLQKPGSSNPEELEIEIAEVLYGLMTSSSSKKEDSKEVNTNNRSIGDSRPNATSPANNPLSAVAPKRKRPRQVLDNPSYAAARSSPISAKPELDQTPISSPNVARVSGSNATQEMGGNSVGLRAEPESVKLDSESKPEELLKESRNLVSAKEEMVSLPKGEELSPASRSQETKRVDSSSMATDSISAATEIQENNPVECETETLRPEKFQIDLMAPPPQVRSSPGRGIGIVSGAVDEKQLLPVLDTEMKPVPSKERENVNGKRWNDGTVNVAAPDVKRSKVVGKETEIEKECEKVRSIDLKLDFGNGVKDGAAGLDAPAGNKAAKLHPTEDEPITEKSGQSTNSLPLPMMPSWPGGLAPPMGYMPPLQGVVPMDGTAVTPPIQSFAQPRPKRCATHCYIARNIHSLQQFMKMNPFWPAVAAAGSTALFGSKPCGVNVAADLQSIAARGVHNALDKMQNPINVPSHAGVKDKSSQSANTPESAHRKKHQQQQILIQPSMPSMAPNNLMGPAFIFPLNQHQAAVAAASARPSTGKASSGGSTTASSNIPGSTGANAPAGGASGAMGFNFPTNMQPVSETQYLAILQNNGAYPFPMAPVGAPPNYRGTPGQGLPLFNGSFYPSQMIHPSQIQSQQPPSTQSHQNASVSCSSSSQKHLHSHQQRSQNSAGPGTVNVQNYPPQKVQPSQQLQQPSENQRPKHLEGEGGNEDSPSDNRGLRASVNIYGQNFSMPMHPQSFALMTSPSGLANAVPNVGSNQSEKKSQQSQHGVKTGMDSLPPHSFAMSFGSMNGAIPGPGIDITSMAQNHAFFQNFPEAARQNMQMMAAAQGAHKKSFRMAEDNKSSGGNDSSTNDDERKILSAKSQSVAFLRSELSDAAIQSSNVLESSTRSLNATSGLVRSSQVMNSNIPSAHIQSQLQNQLQQQQFLMLKQQQQQHQQQQQQQQQHQQQQQQQQDQRQQQQVEGSAAAANSRNKVSNGNIYADHLNSSSTMTAKFPNALSGFTQNLVQSNNNSPAQSPQWKSSTRTTHTSQAPPSLASSTTPSLKNLPQHNSEIRPQMHTQISFGGTQKRSTNSPGQQTTASNHQAPSPPMVVGSPTNSSISKGASGSPRTASASTSNKIGQASALSSQQPQNSQGQKSMSILGNPHTTSSLGGGAKPQSQRHLPKNLQQQHLFFSYPQAQAPHSTSNAGPGGYFMQQQQQQRRRPDQQSPGGPGTASNGMLSMCSPVTLGSAATNDPAKAIAAATSNQNGGVLPSHGIMHAAQFSAQAAGTQLPTGYSYIHPVPTAVQVKPAEQKQPAGQPEKK